MKNFLDLTWVILFILCVSVFYYVKDTRDKTKEPVKEVHTIEKAVIVEKPVIVYVDKPFIVEKETIREVDCQNSMACNDNHERFGPRKETF
jgi:hypothetical protein